MLPPPPHYRWYIVFLALVNQVLSAGMLVYSFALFVVPWLSEFGVSRSHAMMAIFLLQVACSLANPGLGRLMDLYAMRLLVLAGVLCIGLGLLLLSVASVFWQTIAIHATLLPVGMLLCGTLASHDHGMQITST